MSDLNRRFWLWFGLSALAAGLILLFMPQEKTLGPIIKLVYLHGALSRAGMIGFWAAGLAGAAYLWRQDAAFLRWSKALLWSGWAYWVAHFVVSMPATRLTWGPWVAWGEPRVTMTLQVIVVGLVVTLADRLLDGRRFAAAANLLLAAAVFVLVERTGVLRHPLDPIGASPSAALRAIYLALLVPIIAGMVLAAWRLTRSGPGRHTDPSESASQKSRG
ncbi:MAG: hypothetical protein ACP5UQ_08565 [Anaerolineae bacterium]